MERFDETDDGDAEGHRVPSERLRAFTKALWDALVPKQGPCASVQGELIRANERLQAEHYRNGMANYFAPREEHTSGALADNYYGELVLFLLDTMVANRNQALTEEDVAYFATMRREIEAQWARALRSDELYYKADEEKLSQGEEEELASLDELRRGPDWEELCSRASRCIANWCLANTMLIDRHGKPVVERGIRDVMHIFDPPPAPRQCGLCEGKGWIPARQENDFPAMCSCRK
jgi:hypothetical protein